MSKVKKKYLKAATVALAQWMDNGVLMPGYWGTKVPDEAALLQAVALLLQESAREKP